MDQAIPTTEPLMPNVAQPEPPKALMEVYHPITKEKLTVPQDQAYQGLIMGQYDVPAAADYDVLKDTGELGGNSYKIKGVDLVKALKGGFTFDTPEAKAIRAYKRDNQGVLGGTKAFAASAANQALIGIPEVAAKLGASRWLPDFVNKNTLTMEEWEALHEIQPGAALAGGVTGFVGSLLGGPASVAARAASATGGIAERGLSKIIGATAAEQVGSRTAAQAAKEIVSKLGGAAVEGATFMAPQAATEAVLGDPQAAAESLITGGLVGGIFGGTSMLGSKLIKEGQKLISPEKIETVGQAIKETGKSALNVATGINRESMEHYIRNPEAVNSAISREEIIGKIDDIVSKNTDDLVNLKTDYDVAKNNFDGAYKEKLNALKSKEAPREAATKLMDSLNQSKETLGNLSDEVENVLEQSGITMRRQDVQKALTDIQNSLGSDISDVAAKTRKTLENYKSRLKSGFGGELTGGEVRQIMRSVRNDITSFGQGAGVFNDVQNNAIMSFTESLSGKLKNIPEYNALMEQMAPISKTLKEMSKVAGTEEKAFNFLNTVIKNNGKAKIKDELLEKWQKISGVDLVTDLTEVRAAKELLEKAKVSDIASNIVPKEYLEHETAKQAFERQKEIFDRVKRVSPARSQSIVKNMLGNNPNKLDAQALKELSELTGEDFLGLLKNTKSKEAFEKETTQGSRKTLGYAAAGASVGGGIAGPAGALVGGAIGAATGMASDKFGTAWAKKALDVLRLADEHVKLSTGKLQGVKPWLTDLQESGKLKAAARMPLNQLFGVKDSYKNDDEAMENIRSKASQLVANPNLLQERIKQYTTPLMDAGATKVAEQLNLSIQKSVKYVLDNVPKETLAQSPFAPKIKVKPTASQLYDFKNKMEVLADPWTVMSHVKNGTLSPAHVDSLQANYPALYNYMKIHIEHAAATSPVPLSYQKRITLGTLFGSALDSSLQPGKLLDLQNSFIAPEDGSKEKQAEIDIASQSILKTDKFQQA